MIGIIPHYIRRVWQLIYGVLTKMPRQLIHKFLLWFKRTLDILLNVLNTGFPRGCSPGWRGWRFRFHILVYNHQFFSILNLFELGHKHRIFSTTLIFHPMVDHIGLILVQKFGPINPNFLGFVIVLLLHLHSKPRIHRN